MTTISTNAHAPSARIHLFFAGWVVFSSLACLQTLIALVHYSFHDPSSSHIILIPFISFFLLYTERRQVFSVTTPNVPLGLIVACGALVLYLCAHRGLIPREGDWALSAATLAVILLWVGGYIACYGRAALSAGAFSMLFLLLMVPVPAPILNSIIHALQEGSTDVAYSIFKLVGTPVLRQGFVLNLPSVTIEVAQECSSIRSSMALFITSLLASHLYLRTGWKKLLLVVLIFPLSLVKNGVRIATLTLLSIYVDPSFLTGSLHRDGGFAFFFLALLIILPVFLWMETSDRRATSFKSAA